jgi:D,D-heptose 1,7-bisphosphate phosphatase
MKVIIMAGGKGTRAASIASDIPKPMIPINGKPVLEYQIECFARNNLTDITIVIGHLGSQITEYFGDGSRFGCIISYFTETEPLGTAGALYKLEYITEDFILVNGDIIFDMDFSRMISFHKKTSAWATLAVHPNSHPYDSALIITGTDNQVIGWLNKEENRTYHKNQVNSGVHILSHELIKNIRFDNEKIDLDREILKPAINTKKIYAYRTPEYIKDMGTPERYSRVCADIQNGIVQGRNLRVKQRAVFLDRDGTINILRDFIKKPEDLELIEGSAEAIKKINNLGYLAIVVTNQPVIARGETDFETLDLIHMKMETELGKSGAYIDDLFFCPHHPDKGFPGERPEFKIECDCRKPKPGMILKAAEKYNIDLSKSYMAGDDLRDVESAINAGCTPVFLSTKKIDECDIMRFRDLKEFSEYLS